jgi:superoxide dismutase, Fe-Mn family
MFTLPKLPYAYDALEPHIDKKTMLIHHTKHHQGYIDNLNKQIEKYPELGDKSLAELLIDLDSVPADARVAVRNNGGGHWNHSFFWDSMRPSTGSGSSSGEPKGELAKAIKKGFGDFEKFKAVFKQAALTRFGSGWAWLGIDHDGILNISSTPNQDNLLMGGNDAILGIDVWEHAYYLKYQNKRGDYLDAFWPVVNWKKVGERFEAARTK